MSKNNNKLFTDFSPIGTEEWKAKITADLKGADYEKKLVWRTNEGFSAQPFYRLEDVEKLNYLNTLPGEFPFVRSVKTNNNDWYVRQNIEVGTDLEAANKKALDVLNKGVTSLGFVFDSCSVHKFEAKDLDVLLKDICLEAIEVNLIPHCTGLNQALAIANYIGSCKCNSTKVNASVAIDPLATYMLKGALKHGIEGSVSKIKEAIEATKSIPNLRVIAVNAKIYGNSGASVVQELGFALAHGAEYLTLLTEAGLNACEVAKNIKFNFSISANYFMEIAKFRAGHMLWAKIAKAYTGECGTTDCCKMNAHAETGSWNKSIYDSYVNMLRTQTESMSAALGGVDSITVSPFNETFEKSTLFSERIARNQQLLLKEESHFDKIVDPSAGSYYIEELTASIIEQTWALFLAIQDKGGFIAATKSGFIQREIKEMANKRNLDIATRRENLLGINQFPNFTEKLTANLAPEVFEATDLAVENAEIETLKPYRGSMAFERLRLSTDKYSASNKRPLAFMLTIGNLTMRKARAQFACNFFAVAGYQVQEGKGYETVAEGLADAKANGADIIVICSSDDEYATLAPEAYKAIDGKSIFVVAGAPLCTAELKAIGINNFVHVKSNLLEELSAYNLKLGIK